MRSRAWMLQLAALTGAGSVAVHQLRYLLGYHEHAGAALAAEGHSYMGVLSAALTVLLLVAVAALIRRVAGGSAIAAPRLGPMWIAASNLLLAVYFAQELAEGALPIAHGGWVAFPLAVLVGFVIALAMRGAGAAAELAGTGRPWDSPGWAVAHRIVARARFAALRNTHLVASARGPPDAS